MDIRKALQLAAILIFITAPLLALGKNPHTAQPLPGPEMESCDCSPGFVLNEATNPDQYEGTCTVEWTTYDGAWEKFGADIEFEAEWFDVSDMSADSETDIEEYSCVDGDFDIEADIDDQRCTATAVAVVIPLHSDTGSIEFEAKVKGFDRGQKGPKDFVKSTADCSPLPVLP